MSDEFQKNIPKHLYPIHPSTLKFYTTFKNCVFKSLNKRGWKELDHDADWDIAWVEKEAIHEIFDRYHLTPTQKVNHFRNHFELTRKDNLIKNLKRHKRMLEKEGRLEESLSFNFFPQTYNLPNEYSIFCDEFKRNSNCIWIMKPIGKCQGRGIFLFKKLSQISEWKNEPRTKGEASAENYVVQRYINNPLLVGGKKFDMRIYALVTSYSPLTVYLYRDGFARFTHHRYDNSDISNAYVHLTNVAIQKHSENYDKKLGGKWDLRTLKLYLISKYGQEKVNECFTQIQLLIVKTLQSVQKVIINDKHCFELYGFDIIINDKLKPWVLEVNGSPSMTANTKHDCELKCGLIDDTFTIIDLEKILTGQEDQIGGYDLICKGEPLTSESGRNTTMLGCYNNRNQQLKTLSKVIASKLAQNYVPPQKEEPGTNPKRQSKDISTGLPVISASTESSITSRKLRSKSSAKGPPSSSGPSILNQTSKVATKTLFPKQVVVPGMINEPPEFKENREGSAPVKHNRFKIFKGKTVILPPVSNSSTNTINVNSNNTLTSISNSGQLDSQKTIFNNQPVMNQTPSLANGAIISNRASQPVDPNIKLTQHPQQPLSVSLSAYASHKGAHSINSMNIMNTEPNTNSPGLPVQVSGLLGMKAKNESFMMAYNSQNPDLYDQGVNKSSPLQRKIKKDTLSTSQDLGKINEGDDIVKIYTESDREPSGKKEDLKKSFIYTPSKNVNNLKNETLADIK